MKSLFPSYYQPTPQEFEQLWKECVFVFDTNMLFYLYRSSEAARNELLNLLRQLQDRIWLPYQVAFEYQRDRLNTIDGLSKDYDRLIKALTDIKTINLTDRGVTRHPILEATLCELQTRTDRAFNDYKAALEPIKSEIESLKSTHPKWHEHDTNRDEIDTLFDGKIGKLYSPENLNKIFLEGEARYEKKIPPGYEDKDKEDTKKYGDLVLWFQTIDYAREKQTPIIFITDDRKEDWWLGGRDHKEDPRPELIQEFFDETGFRFYAYQPNQFLTLAEKYLQLSTSEATKEEIHAIGDAVALEERNREIILRSSGNPFSKAFRDTFPYNLKLLIPEATPNDLQALKYLANRQEAELKLNKAFAEQQEVLLKVNNAFAERFEGQLKLDKAFSDRYKNEMIDTQHLAERGETELALSKALAEQDEVELKLSQALAEQDEVELKLSQALDELHEIELRPNKYT